MLRKIDNSSPLPKYYQISDSIKEKIACGEFSVGNKIPTCRELMKYFNTTVVTISSAMRQLENDGYISKVQGKGMFVTVPATAASKAVAGAAVKKVGIIMPTRGDLYQNLSDTLVHELEQHDTYTIPLSITLLEDNVNLEHKEKLLKKYIAAGFDSLVINGTRDFPYKLLYKYRDAFRQLNFIAHCESGIDFPEANVIVFDAAQVGRLAAKYLIESGRKNFLWLSIEEPSKQLQTRNGCRGKSFDMSAREAMKSVLREAGFPKSALTVLKTYRHGDEEKLSAALSGVLAKGPSGVFAIGDFHAVPVYRIATMMGLDFKKSLSIVGLYNTSWGEILNPAMTSISIQEAEIAEIAADCIINRKTGQRILVEPKLIKRET